MTNAVQELIANPNFQMEARKVGLPPEQYFQSLDQQAKVRLLFPQQSARSGSTAPPGSHRMPDGSVMANSQMQSAPTGEASGSGLSSQFPVGDTRRVPSFPEFDRRMKPPVLQQVSKNLTTPPALQNLSSTGQGGALSLGSDASRPTANRRGSKMPFAKIGMGETLVRMGGALAGADGSPAGQQAMAEAYAGVKDYNRGVDASNYSEAQRLAELRIADAAAKTDKDAFKPDNEAIGSLRVGMSKLREALSIVRSSDGSLTGTNLSALWSKLDGKFRGNKNEASRMFLKEIGLDVIMDRIAQTKGAISNKEMDLFAAPVPDVAWTQESVWEAWMMRRLKASEALLYRLENGITVDPEALLSETMPDLPPESSGDGTGGDPASEDVDIEKLLEKYGS